MLRSLRRALDKSSVTELEMFLLVWTFVCMALGAFIGWAAWG